MSRRLYGIGAIGAVVQEIQAALADADCDPICCDGVYGLQTVAAVSRFQRKKGFPSTGAVDLDTWGALTAGEAPSLFRRCLELTAALEGHGYALAVGNFDGALLTWGIIGFTLADSELPGIVETVDGTHPELLDQAFGHNADVLRQVLAGSSEEQQRWAGSVSTRSGMLAEPWRSGFAWYGQSAVVQEEQRRRAREDYFVPAIATAKRYRLTTELGLALCFDIHVQNGGIKPAARPAIWETMSALPSGASEQPVREAIAAAVAHCAREEYRADVRARKMMIATGAGEVHGHKFLLENWGLSESPAAELLQVRSAAAAFS